MTSIRPFEKIDTIHIHNLTKTYGNVTAVSGINLDIIGGELMVLIGGSGSGIYGHEGQGRKGYRSHRSGRGRG